MKVIKKEKYISKLEQAHKKHFEDIKAKNIFYCPFCRNILEKGKYPSESHKNSKRYKCTYCNSNYFNHDTQVEKHTAKLYHINGDRTKVQDKINNIILTLAKDGFSINEIHDLTHFSKELIRKNLSNINKQSITRSLSEFMNKKLQVPKEYCKNDNTIKSINLKDKEKHIHIAYESGLRYDLITKIFFISKRDVFAIVKNYEMSLSYESLLRIYKERELHSYKLSSKNNVLQLEKTTKISLTMPILE